MSLIDLGGDECNFS